MNKAIVSYVLLMQLLCISWAPRTASFPQTVDNQPIVPPKPVAVALRECPGPFECVDVCRCRKEDIIQSEDPLSVIIIKSELPNGNDSSHVASAVEDCFKVPLNHNIRPTGTLT
jgi:hypothetical protein